MNGWINQRGPWYYMGFLNLSSWGLGLTVSFVDMGYWYVRVVLGPFDLEIGRDVDVVQ